MSWSFWLAGVGILLNLFGTLLLVFSIPAVMHFAYMPRGDGVYEPYLAFETPNHGEPNFRFGWRLFKNASIRRDILTALLLLFIGAIFQIGGLWLDC